MNAASEEVLSRLADGELVDPDELRTALAEPDAVDTLVAYATVQRIVADPTATPGERFYETMRARLAVDAPRRRVAWRLPLTAAAMIVVSVLGGIWLGSSLRAPVGAVPPAMRATTTRPPAPTPASVSSPLVEAAPDTRAQVGCPTERPPKASRVFVFTLVEARAGSRGLGNTP